MFQTLDTPIHNLMDQKKQRKKIKEKKKDYKKLHQFRRPNILNVYFAFLTETGDIVLASSS